MKIGLALGGGAARGLAHIGILKVLKENGIRVQALTGTSMGAIIGALYIVHNDIAEITERVKRFLTGPLFYKSRIGFFRQQLQEEQGGRFSGIAAALKKGYVYTVSMRRASYVREDLYMDIIASVLPDVKIEDLSVPFAVVATDLVKGEEVVLTKGPLRQAVAASAAIPGLLPPIRLDGRTLVDGGWIDQVPIRPAYRLGAEFVLAVDVGEELDRVTELGHSLEIINRANFVARKRLMRLLCEEADLLWRPTMPEVHWADFSQLERALVRGEETARAGLEELKAAIRRSTPKRILRYLTPWID
ncbi:MAG: patatin-like phospholipase family protein [Nitrospirae bacterium]|nr:patatin-like phospholipase family protein [Nitrospirota bacterium]